MSDVALEWILDVTIWMVVVGVLLEGVEYIEEIRAHGWQLKNPWKALPIFGFAILVVGLAGEWYASTVIHGRDADRIASLSPRDLNLKQRLAIAALCGSFSKRPVIVTSPAGDTESFRLGAEILDALSRAGIHPQDRRANNMVVGGINFGLRVVGPSSEQDFVQCLEEGLGDIGKIKVDGRVYPHELSGSEPTAIIIGLKPMN